MKRLSFFLTEQQIQEVRELATRIGVKFAEMLRRVIDKGVREKKKEQQRAHHHS